MYLIADWRSTIVDLLSDILMVRRAVFFGVLRMSYKSYRWNRLQSYLLEVHAFGNEFCQSTVHQWKSLTICKTNKFCLESLSWIICIYDPKYLHLVWCGRFTMSNKQYVTIKLMQNETDLWSIILVKAKYW